MPVTKEQKLEYMRQWRAANANRAREWRERNRDKINQQRRERNGRNPEVRRSQQQRVSPEQRYIYNMQARHGSGPELLTALWEAQGGKCYLCGRDLILGKALIDHDHGCCPTNKSCANCRRGLVHRLCNSIIGYLEDDPDQLRRMATALEAAKQITAQKISLQGSL